MSLLLFLGFSLVLGAQDGGTGRLAPYYPTPELVVEKMLLLGELKPGEKMFDLGSGDGRIVIMAAEKFHADATGVELDKNLARQSRTTARPDAEERRARGGARFRVPRLVAGEDRDDSG